MSTKKRRLRNQDRDSLIFNRNFLISCPSVSWSVGPPVKQESKVAETRILMCVLPVLVGGGACLGGDGVRLGVECPYPPVCHNIVTLLGPSTF